MIPPGLLGYDPVSAAPAAASQHVGSDEVEPTVVVHPVLRGPFELTVAVHPVLRGPYSALYDPAQCAPS